MSEDTSEPNGSPEGSDGVPEAPVPDFSGVPEDAAQDIPKSIDEATLDFLYDFLKGGMPTSFFLTFEYLNEDGAQSWGYANLPGQSLATSMGLNEWARGLLRYAQGDELDSFSYDYVLDDDDDDPDF